MTGYRKNERKKKRKSIFPESTCCERWNGHDKHGAMPLEDYLDIKAIRYGFSDYAELRASGYRLDGDCDPDPDQDEENVQT